MDEHFQRRQSVFEINCWALYCVRFSHFKPPLITTIVLCFYHSSLLLNDLVFFFNYCFCWAVKLLPYHIEIIVILSNSSEGIVFALIDENNSTMTAFVDRKNKNNNQLITVCGTQIKLSLTLLRTRDFVLWNFTVYVPQNTYTFPLQGNGATNSYKNVLAVHWYELLVVWLNSHL